jgi:hypothetical protein
MHYTLSHLFVTSARKSRTCDCFRSSRNIILGSVLAMTSLRRGLRLEAHDGIWALAIWHKCVLYSLTTTEEWLSRASDARRSGCEVVTIFISWPLNYHKYKYPKSAEVGIRCRTSIIVNSYSVNSNSIKNIPLPINSKETPWPESATAACRWN